MTIELLQTLSLASYIAAGVLFLVSIAMFFLLEVPKLFGDLTGSTAKRAIESIRQQNETTGNKAYKPSPVNAARGKVTDKISQSGRLLSKERGMGVTSPTERFRTADLAPASSETTVLKSAASETTVLRPTASETTILGMSGDGTTVIGGGMMPVGSETTVLSRDQIMNDERQASLGEGLKVDFEMSFLGSSELIE